MFSIGVEINSLYLIVEYRGMNLKLVSSAIMHLLCIAILFPCQLIGQFSFSLIDSLRAEVSHVPQSIEAVDLLNDISYAFRRNSPDSMMLYALKALELGQLLEYKKGQSLAFKNLGIAKYKQGFTVKEIIEDYEKAISIAKQENDFKIQIACLNNIGLVYHSANESPRALLLYFEALDLYKSQSLIDDRLKGLLFGNIAGSYRRMGDEENEKEYITKALDFAEKNKYLDLYAIYSDNLAMVYNQEGNYQEAIEQCEKGMKIQVQVNDMQSYLQTLNTLSISYLNIGDIQKSLDCSFECAKKADSLHYKLITAEAFIGQSKAYRLLNESESSLEAGKIAFDLLSTSDRFAAGSEVALLLSDIYKERKDFENSLFYYEWYHKSESRSLDQRANYMAAELGVKYKNDARILEIESLNLANKRRGQLIYFLIFISMVLAAFLYGGFRLFKVNKRTTFELTQKNTALYRAEKNLEHKNQELEKYIESNIQLEQFAHVASHDLKSPLRTISSFTGLLKKNFSFDENEKARGYLNFIEQATKQMSALISDLLSFSQVNSQKLNITKVYPADIFISVREILADDIMSKNARIVINSLPKVIYADETKFKRICQNLITNAIKFVKPGTPPVVQIHGQELEDAYVYSIRDNGIGISKEFLKEIFHPYKQLNTKSEYEGSGLGLSITKKLVEQHNGTLSVHSELDIGSTFTITIPKHLKKDLSSVEQQ